MDNYRAEKPKISDVYLQMNPLLVIFFLSCHLSRFSWQNVEVSKRVAFFIDSVSLYLYTESISLHDRVYN